MPVECPVTVSIEWAARVKKKVLPEELSSLGKILCRGRKKQIARAAWHCDEIRSHLYVEVAKQIHKECVAMCVRGTEKETKRRQKGEKIAVFTKLTRRVFLISNLII